MRKRLCVMLMSMSCVWLSAGCQNTQTRVGEGALIGGVLGAAAGSIIGHQSGETGEGAAIGAAAGILGGSLVGAQMKKQPSETVVPAQQGAQPAATNRFNPQQMSVQDVVELTRQGIHEEVIIDRLRLTGSAFTLTDSDTAYLKQQGVSDAVITAMQGA